MPDNVCYLERSSVRHSEQELCLSRRSYLAVDTERMRRVLTTDLTVPTSVIVYLRVVNARMSKSVDSNSSQWSIQPEFAPACVP